MNSSHHRRLRSERLEPRHMLTGVLINEIHYDPDFATEQVEFIELYNDGDVAVALSNWVIDDAVDFLFPNGSSIEAGGYAVVAENAAEFEAKFGFAPLGQWEAGDKLSNEGENIELRDALGSVVDEVHYQLGFPWPTVGASGASVELISPSLDNNLAGSWRSSQGEGGLPNSPVTLLARESTNWRYRTSSASGQTGEASSPVGEWRMPDFNEDATWATGQTPVGYGDFDDNTPLNDMRFNYSSVYLRNFFTIDGAVPSALRINLYVDDGAIVWINGVRAFLFNMEDQEPAFDDTSLGDHEAQWEEFLIPQASQFLTSGENTIAVQGFNTSTGSSDFSLDAEVVIPSGSELIGIPSPGARNSVFSENTAPQLRQLEQSVEQPVSGEDVVISIKATDPDGVAQVELEYQLVNPGSYIRITDGAYQTNWTTIAMRDDGLEGDAIAGDDHYSAILPGNLNTHRRLVRYRITATDDLGASVTGPYGDDPQPNFAYFVYDGVPDYTGSLRPGVQPSVTYSGDVLDDMATYHLIADAGDVQNSQYNGQFNKVQFRATMVYDGVVYDHIEFRNRGVASTYQVGKNKWKINFLRGHGFEARDDYGNKYDVPWDKMNILPGTNPWWKNDRSTEGTVLFEPVAFKLYELAGAPSPHTQYFEFRIIDAAAESVPGNQYAGDFWGLYFGIEQPDGKFLDERGLPDGNIYNMHGGAFGSTTQRSQGSQLPTDRSDLQQFLSGINSGFRSLEWWEENLNWESYFGWNIINHAVNNSDIRPNENVNYYHNQETGQWHTIPWDLDLTFEDAEHLSRGPVTMLENIRSLMEDHPTAQIAYENRVREVLDLLFDSGDAALVVQQYADLLTFGGSDYTITDSNQAQWDYHPQKNKSGIWYDNFTPEVPQQQGDFPAVELSSKDFDGLVQYMRDFLTAGGYGYEQLASRIGGSNAPRAPLTLYDGPEGFPQDQLDFRAGRFADPNDREFAAMEWRLAEVHSPHVANYDPNEPNIYEIQGTWESAPLNVFTPELRVPSHVVEPGKTYRLRVRMQNDAGYWSSWSAAEEFLVTSPTTSPAGDVVISEINYHPHDPTPSELAELPGVAADEFDFIEVLNINPTDAVNLGGYQMTGGVTFTFDSLVLGPGERAVVVENLDAFEARYGSGVAVAGSWSGGLSNGGEDLVLSDSGGRIVVNFSYGDSDPWPSLADGDGATLELINPNGTPAKQFAKYYRWRASTEWGGTPGAEGVGALGVVINEVLAHTDQPDSDTIELYNPGSEPVDLGGWFLSDSSGDLLKFEIPAGTELGPNQYLVFDEDDFNPTPTAPGPNDFSLNGARGDDVYLAVPNGLGGVAQFVDHVQFGGSANGESFGRVPNGAGRLAPMASPTLGSANGSPRIGPLVVTEVNYHPEDPSAAALAIEPNLGDNDLEFVEIHNPSGGAIDLTNWQLRGEVDFDFAPGSTLAAGGTLVLTPFDPDDPNNQAKRDAFRAHYQIDGEVMLAGGFDGSLNNSFGVVRLERPDQPPLDDPLFTPHITVDEVLYDDLAPWPASADGDGFSLTRVGMAAYGNNASSWQAAAPTPGEVSAGASANFDGDGDVDGMDFLAWQRGFGRTTASKEDGDADHDGDVDQMDLTVWQEQFGQDGAAMLNFGLVPNSGSVTTAATTAPATHVAAANHAANAAFLVEAPESVRPSRDAYLSPASRTASVLGTDRMAYRVAARAIHAASRTIPLDDIESDCGSIRAGAVDLRIPNVPDDDSHLLFETGAGRQPEGEFDAIDEFFRRFA